MAKRKTKKKYTLTEFQAWLEGVEELQPAGWSPDANQWKLIRDKISNIVEPEPTIVEKKVEPEPTIIHPVQPQLPPSALMEDPWAAPDVPLPAGPIMEPEMTPAARAALQGKLPKDMVPDASGKIKTRDIEGEYNSSFL